MALHADAGCILKVNVHCEACKMKAMAVLSYVVGVYSITIDADEGIASIYGGADPNMFIRAIATSGRHGQHLVHANVKHPQINDNGSYNYGHGYNYRRIYPGYRPLRNDDSGDDSPSHVRAALCQCSAKVNCCSIM